MMLYFLWSLQPLQTVAGSHPADCYRLFLLHTEELSTRTLNMGSIVLPHLRSGWHVDQAILSEEDRLVVIRFGKDGNPDCLRQDDVLSRIANAVQNFAVM
jgi:hypothetical protein